MTFADRLKALMDERGYNPTSLARACGFGTTAVRDWIAKPESEPLGGRLYRVAEVLEVRMEDLLGEPRLSADMDGAEYARPAAANDGPASNVIMIPEYDVQLAAGTGKLNEIGHLEAKSEWPFTENFLRTVGGKLDMLSVVEVIGDSMMPQLAPHDQILINHADTNPTPPGIFALWDGYGLVVKRVQRVHRSDPEKLLLISENVSYPAYEVFVEEISIIGRVVWYSRRM